MTKIDFIKLDDTEVLLEWLASDPNPDLWHQIVVGGINYDSPNANTIIHWIVSNPLCDRATAAAALILTCAYDYIYLDAETMRSPSDDVQMIAETICRNSQKEFYARSNIGIRPYSLWLDPMTLIEKIEASCIEKLGSLERAIFPIPRTLFIGDFSGPPAKSGYVVDEDGITNIDSFSPEMRKHFE